MKIVNLYRYLLCEVLFSVKKPVQKPVSKISHLKCLKRIFFQKDSRKMRIQQKLNGLMFRFNWS